MAAILLNRLRAGISSTILAHPGNARLVLENVDMLTTLEVTQKPPSGEGRSMSTSLLYHSFGLIGYRYVRQTFQGGRVTFRIEQPRERLCCPQCGDADVWV